MNEITGLSENPGKKIILETERLLLRELNTGDFLFILELLNSPSWLQFIGNRHVYNKEDAINFILNGPVKNYETNGFGLYLAALKETEIPIGMCGLIKRAGLDDIDIGFAFLEGYSGKGYGHEIAEATMAYGKNNLGIKKIVAITTSDNVNSIKLLNKLGLYYKKMIQLGEEDLMLFEENAD